jgi:Kelch motif/Bacterial Ig-like domain (group 2)
LFTTNYFGPKENVPESPVTPKSSRRCTNRIKTLTDYTRTIATHASSRQFWRTDAEKGHFAIYFGRILSTSIHMLLERHGVITSDLLGDLNMTSETVAMRKLVVFGIVSLVFLVGCGGGSSTSSSTPTPSSPPLISVTVTPNSATVFQGATQSFAATVTGTTNIAVTWSVQENGGGTIDSTGLYTAPQGTDGTFHVVATSQANSAAKGIAAVTVQQPQLTISPAAVTLAPGGAQTFTASVAGFPNANLTWTVQETGGGVINSAGFYTAPGAAGFYHVVATSVEDTTLTASSTVTVTTSSSRFTPTGSMNEARGLQTATLLPDNNVLVAYGSNSGAYTNVTGYVGLSSIEVYDAGTGTFTEIVGEDGAGTFGHTATLLPNGEVLLAGGFGNSVWDYGGSTSYNEATLYDSATGVFSGTGNMTVSRGGHTATLLANGKVLIAGGADQDPTGTGLASAELYDPSTGTFTQTGSMAVGRFLHTATLLQNGKVLVVGGALTSTSDPVASAELYDPVTGSFTITGAMATAREQHTATLLADGRVLIVGGTTPTSTGDFQPTATVEIYDPSTGSFSVTGSMAEARSFHTATLLPSGNVLVAGGGVENSTAELYDPATGSFSITGGMEIGRSGHTATLLPNGSVLVAGGGIFAGLASAELYK